MNPFTNSAVNQLTKGVVIASTLAAAFVQLYLATRLVYPQLFFVIAAAFVVAMVVGHDGRAPRRGRDGGVVSRARRVRHLAGLRKLQLRDHVVVATARSHRLGAGWLALELAVGVALAAGELGVGGGGIVADRLPARTRLLRRHPAATRGGQHQHRHHAVGCSDCSDLLDAGPQRGSAVVRSSVWLVLPATIHADSAQRGDRSADHRDHDGMCGRRLSGIRRPALRQPAPVAAHAPRLRAR